MPECVEKNQALTLGQKSDDYCMICAISGIGDEPAVQLECKHIFHFNCLKGLLSKRWPGPRIVFSYLNCTSCKQRMKASYCKEITQIIEQAEKVEKEIHSKAEERGKYENLAKDEKLKDKYNDPGHRFYKNFKLMCIESLSYYECYECKQPYFGGQKNCEMAQEEAKEYKPQELVCGKCSAKNVGMGEVNCKKHGTDYIEFKCKFCCEIAQWFCWGNTHFCEKCHTRQNNGDYVSRKPKSELPRCPGAERCPLKIQHPPNGEEYSLGCSICRNERANVKAF